MNLDEQYWSNRYSNDTAVWDTGSITTPIKEYIDQLHNQSLNILIPGCGNSHEAEYLLQKGFHSITLIDISTLLCRQLVKKLAPYKAAGLQIICGDFFDHHGQYDLIVEQTFFCALDPSLRNAYAAKMQQLLRVIL
jgi:methyl halide transferase